MTEDEFNKAQALLTQEAAYFDALLARDKSKKAWQAASVPAPVAAVPPTADQHKAVADADKAAVETAAARRKAVLDAFPSSGITGTAESGDGAGKAEAMLLGAVALRQLAREFAYRLAKKLKHANLVLCTPATPLRFDHLAQFDAQHQAVKAAMEAAGLGTEAATEAAGQMANAATVALALTVAQKLLGYLTADHKLSGLDVKSADDMLVVALAEQLIHLDRDVFVPALFQPHPPAGDGPVFNRLAAPFHWAQRVDDSVSFLERRVAEQEAEAARAKVLVADAATSAELKAQAELELRHIEASLDQDRSDLVVRKSLAERLDTWIKQLTTADAQGRLPICLVSQQEQLRQLLTDGVVVVVQPHQMAGSLYNKRNLWTTLGWFTPFRVMGGAVAACTAFDGATGRVLLSSYLPQHSGYHRVNAVEAVVRQAAAIRAWKPRDPDGVRP